ncbi:hypothetical protein DFH08DRAFT_816472 [Mycena albidolilacea]|uniref:Uncharacterized protein n=1 Tax=Mycena albidolilacea TaxID=1033008 RepID=A0AAD7EI23_9AGAR|nr:hypothetical protein DFH08DRAFT_816472 [Mycena albidolilacea]
MYSSKITLLLSLFVFNTAATTTIEVPVEWLGSPHGTDEIHGTVIGINPEGGTTFVYHKLFDDPERTVFSTQTEKLFTAVAYSTGGSLLATTLPESCTYIGGDRQGDFTVTRAKVVIDATDIPDGPSPSISSSEASPTKTQPSLISASPVPTSSASAIGVSKSSTSVQIQSTPISNSASITPPTPSPSSTDTGTSQSSASVSASNTLWGVKVDISVRGVVYAIFGIFALNFVGI